MSSGDSFSRGRYGISPEARATAYQKLRFKVRIHVANIVSLLCGPFFYFLRKISADPELALIEEACRTADFDVVRPLRIPRGYTISDLDEIPGSPEIVRFVLRNEAGDQFLMEQRKAWLPLEEEVTSARVPFTRIKVKGSDCYVIFGFYGGEPIDHAYWFNQLSMALEIEGVVVELQEIKTMQRSVKLWVIFHFVRSLMS
ncbi:MAG: hypothetical protein OXP75_19335 [Rhodospirillales bacterium]|nr:hypothetical protein [Rhodospirillales bacterium]